MTHYTLYAAPVSEIVPQIGWPVIPVMRSKDGALVQDTLDIIESVEADFAKANEGALEP